MHLAAQGSTQKRKTCIHLKQMNLFSKWYCNANTLSHIWSLWTSYVIILIQCNVLMNFQNFVIPVPYHDKFQKNLYTTWLVYNKEKFRTSSSPEPFSIRESNRVDEGPFELHHLVVDSSHYNRTGNQEFKRNERVKDVIENEVHYGGNINFRTLKIVPSFHLLILIPWSV